MKQNWLKSSKDTLKLALPILGAHIVEALIPFMNTALAASFGETALAAAGLVGSTFLAVMGFCWGIIAAVGILTANQIGQASKLDQIGLTFKAGILTALILSGPLMLLFHNIQPIWSYFGQDKLVADLGQEYFNGLRFAVFADLAKFAIFQFAIACGKPRIPLIANIISIPILYISNILLMKVFGIAGIGYGTSITYCLLFISMLIYLFRSDHFKEYFIKHHGFKSYVRACYEQFRLGVPIGFMFSIELLFFVAMALLMGKISATTLAANQIAMQWMWLTIMLAHGLTEAITILVAKCNGAKEFKTLLQYSYSGIVLAGISMSIVGIIYWLVPQLLIDVDISASSDLKLTVLTTQMLKMCAIYQILDSVRIVIAGVLRGIGDSQFPMWVSGIAFWLIGFPIGYGLAFVLEWQGVGLWIGVIVAALFSILCQYYRLKQKLIKVLI